MNQNQSAPSPMGNKPKIKPWLLIVLAVVVLAAIGFFVWNNAQKNKIVAPAQEPTSAGVPIVAPTSTRSATPTSTTTPATITPEPTTTPTPEPTVPSTAWKTFTTDQDLLSFQYPSDWFAKYDNWGHIFNITNKESCLQDSNLSKMTDSCQLITINNAFTGSSQVAATEKENNLKKNSYYITGSIVSGDITVRTYFSSAYSILEAYFDVTTTGNSYHAISYGGSAVDKTDTIETMKKILATVKIAPAQ